MKSAIFLRHINIESELHGIARLWQFRKHSLIVFFAIPSLCCSFFTFTFLPCTSCTYDLFVSLKNNILAFFCQQPLAQNPLETSARSHALHMTPHSTLGTCQLTAAREVWGTETSNKHRLKVAAHEKTSFGYVALWWFIILEGSINLLYECCKEWWNIGIDQGLNLSFVWPKWWNLSTRYGFILNWVCLSCVYVEIICSIYNYLFHSFNTCFGLQCNLSSTIRSSLCLNHCEDLSPFGENSMLYTFCLRDYGVLMRSTKFDDVNDFQCKEINDVTIPHCKVVGWPSSFAGFTYLLSFCNPCVL